MNTTTTNFTTAVTALLRGDPPNGAGDMGAWGETYTALCNAYTESNVSGVHAVWGALVNANPQLADLVKPPRYVIHNAADALQPQPPIDWIIQDIFSAGSISLLAGEPGSGKTWALLDAAVTVATGARWLGYTVSHCPVLIVDEESGPRRLKRRLGDTLRGHDADAHTPVYFVTLARFDLWDNDDVTALHNAIDETGARFVIIDALADLMPGKDENSVKDVQPVFMALRSIAEATQSAVVVIHHLNKNGGYRGSTAIKGAVDLLLSLETANGVMTFKSEKARDVETVQFAASPLWGPDTFTLEPAALEAQAATFNKGQRYVLRYLSKHGPSLLTDITNNADICSKGTARNAVYNLADMALVQRTDRGGQGEAAVYGLTEQGGIASCEL